jgi:hypothetical protein
MSKLGNGEDEQDLSYDRIQPKGPRRLEAWTRRYRSSRGKEASAEEKDAIDGGHYGSIDGLSKQCDEDDERTVEMSWLAERI